jgi:carbon-monoxide dehydrogenase small subunit
MNKSVVTIEGFSKTDLYKKIEHAFLQEGAVQCGYCTPGMVMATAALLNSGRKLDDQTIKLALSGNLCRCTGYQTIFDAIRSLKIEGGQHV